MITMNDILDKVDPELLKLIDASENYASYQKLTPPSSTAEDIVARGNLGLEINPKRPLGISIYHRG